MVTLASRVHYLVGIGCTLGSIPFASYLLIKRQLPVFMGVRFYGGGLDAILVSNWVRLVITAANILVGYWLAQALKIGGILRFLLFPISMFFALGYAAPGPIVAHPIMAVRIVLAWGQLT